VNPILAADRRHILAHTGDLWEKLRAKNVFITGATGFVGSWLLEAISAANSVYALQCKVTTVSRDPDAFFRRSPHFIDDPTIAIYKGNLLSDPLPSGSFDYFIHAATERAFTPTAEEPFGILDRDIRITHRMLEFAHAVDVRQFLFISSGAVYGTAGGLTAIPETFAGAPDPSRESSLYGESKRLSELACASYARVFGLQVTIARLFSFVGPYFPLDEGYAIGNLLRNALNGDSLQIRGDGTARRSFLYAADLSAWLWTILLAGAPGAAYNVGSSCPITIRDLASTIREVVAENATISIEGKEQIGAAPNSYIPDTAKARRELGLEDWVPLSDAVRRTFEYYAGLE